MRTKARKPNPKSKSEPLANGANAPATEVFNLAEAPAYLRVSEAELMRLVMDQALPGPAVRHGVAIPEVADPGLAPHAACAR